MMELSTIKLEENTKDKYAIIYLNRPEKLNALNAEMAHDLYLCFKDILQRGEEIRAVVITGMGKAFCAGGDLGEFKKANDNKYIVNLATQFHKVIKLLKETNIPSLAAINGPCYGVGLSLACACDLRICSEKAKFSVAFTSVGLSPDSSLTFHLPKIIGLTLANEMALLNRVLTAEEANNANLVNNIFVQNEFEEEIRNIAKKLAKGPTLAFGSTKKLFIQSFSNDLNTQLDEELKNIRLNSQSYDFQEGLRAFLERKKPDFKGK
jgi:2-(1,2-epoxy-1,2-dihydrophenyl)acetyl-CoA isomerase